MRRGASWVGGMCLGIALVVSCGTSMKGAVTSMADMLGIDGFVGDGHMIVVDGHVTPSDGHAATDSMVGDARASGNPVNCTPGDAFCDGTRVWTCTYSGTDAFSYGDCNTSATSTTNPGVCTTTACYAGAKACCGRQKNTVEWSFSSPTTFSGFMNTGYEANGTGTLTASCGSIYAYAISPTTTASCTTTSATSVSLSSPASAGFMAGQTITLPNTNVSLSASNTANGVTTTCSTWSGSITLVSVDPTSKVTFNATCTESGKTSFTVVGSIDANK